MKNRLCYGDNLDLLRQSAADESVGPTAAGGWHSPAVTERARRRDCIVP